MIDASRCLVGVTRCSNRNVEDLFVCKSYGLTRDQLITGIVASQTVKQSTMPCRGELKKAKRGSVMHGKASNSTSSPQNQEEIKNEPPGHLVNLVHQSYYAAECAQGTGGSSDYIFPF